MKCPFACVHAIVLKVPPLLQVVVYISNGHSMALHGDYMPYYLYNALLALMRSPKAVKWGPEEAFDENFSAR
jgi:hypothetical protein